MKRFELLQLTTLGDGASAPNVTGSYVVLASRAGYALIKRPELDGAAVTATTICDLDTTNGATDVTATNLTAGQRTAIRTFLVNRLPDRAAAMWDADPPTNRRLLLQLTLRLLDALDIDVGVAVRGFDVAG